MPQYWKALGFTWACALVVMVYIRLNNRHFGKQYGIHDGVLKRLSKQWLWNFLPPVFFVPIAVTVYYAVNNTSIGERGYFQNEFAFVFLGIFCLVLLYSSFDILCFVVSETEERRAFEAFKAQVLSEQSATPIPTAPVPETAPAIQVQHYFRNELHSLPFSQIALIEHRNNKTTCYTYDSGKYRLPTTKEELLRFSEAQGFHWFSPFYGFALNAIAYLVSGGDGSLLIALKSGIQPTLQKQVIPPKEEAQQFFIKIHKNKAHKVRNWYKELMEKKGRPGSERP
ncbi:hypothetical protein GCM10011386_39290 [Parapedobacter defluvii]|uniref:LytTr DNA-binding domain-containing protein n=2 Tax=Parapedobacter defluvii TaxID=2045106 RepID=A0ABQ1MMH4_9SPHI|nr:hypothetical protein GCM10011386_39290 [Parapedobacter defluvii]